AQMRLTHLIEPGLTSVWNSSFNYDGAGDLTGFSLNDPATGVVSDNTQLDELGRPVVTGDTDNGQSSTETTGYTSIGQVQSQTYSVGSGSTTAGVGSTYWGTSDLTANSSPGSLKTEQINLPDGTSNGLTSFNYDPSTKRLQT